MGSRIGRGVRGKRGIGSGKDSYKTSTSKPAGPAKGIKTTKGDGKGKKGSSGRY